MSKEKTPTAIDAAIEDLEKFQAQILAVKKDNVTSERPVKVTIKTQNTVSRVVRILKELRGLGIAGRGM